MFHPSSPFSLRALRQLTCLAGLLALSACKIYSFSGASIGPGIKNISIANFNNEAAGGPVNMSQTLTEKLKEYFQSNSALKIVNNDGQLTLEGTIVGYQLSPVAVTAQPDPSRPDQAALNRLTIRVKARFVNTQDEEQNYDQEFQFYQDFPQNQSLTDVEGRLVPVILDQIVLDIFNRSVANW